MPIWDDVLSERDREVFAHSGHGGSVGFGLRPVILVIDVTYKFTGDKPEPVTRSIARWPRSCGLEAWEAVDHIRELLALAREVGLPVIYTRPKRRTDGRDAGRQADTHLLSGIEEEASLTNRFVEAIAPRLEEIVIDKAKPSAFFGTPLVAHLIDLNADTLILVGGTTSGCVRATAVDGYSYNFRVNIVQECVFDRGEVSHKIALFDLNAKYADVVSIADLRPLLLSLRKGL